MQKINRLFRFEKDKEAELRLKVIEYHEQFGTKATIAAYEVARLPDVMTPKTLASDRPLNCQAWGTIAQCKEFPNLALVFILDIALELSPRWFKNPSNVFTDEYTLSYCRKIDDNLSDRFLEPLAKRRYGGAPAYIKAGSQERD